MRSVVKYVFLGSLLSLTACNERLVFSSLDSGSLAVEPPPVVVPPPPTPEPTPTPPPPPPPEPPAPVSKISNGVCADDSSTSVLSCLKCDVPLNPPAPPQLSRKGQALVDGMAMGCEIRNSSDPVGYRPPTRAEILARLNRLSPTLYPDTAMTGLQRTVVNGLVDTDNSTMRNRLFSGLWYQPPFSDAFETYFGISNAEARYLLCYGSSSTFGLTSKSYLHSKAYLDCTYTSGSCQESAAYVTANTYRDQLQGAMVESINNPYVPPPPTPSKVCTWQKYEGNDPALARQKIAEWTAAGYSVGFAVIEGSGAGYCGITLPDSLTDKTVEIGAYICR